MTANKGDLGSDLSRVDTHVIQPDEYDDIPEITDGMMGRGTIMEDGKPAHRDCPPAGLGR